MSVVRFYIFLGIFFVNFHSVDAANPYPNIILVMADDLGWSDIGSYGGEIKTPNIDSLSKEGIRFSQFYNNAVCGPTRASLLTGLYSQQVGHRGDRWSDTIDFKESATIAEVLKNAGYHTILVGKWQQRTSPLDHGFDQFFGPMTQNKISYYHEVSGNPFFLNRNQYLLPKDFYLTDAINDFSLKFVKEALARKKPFFLYVTHIAPHWPLHAREEKIAAYREKYKLLGWDNARKGRFKRQRDAGIIPTNWEMSPRPAAVHAWNQDKHKAWQAERMSVYAAQIGVIDHGIGQLLSIIEKSGEGDNTIVMFLSDNGAASDGEIGPTNKGFGFGPDKNNGAWRIDGFPIRPGSGPDNFPGPHDTFSAYGKAWANVSNTPFRGSKLTCYEGGIRTPLVVRWPKMVSNPGRTTNQVGHVMDIMATFVEIVGADLSYDFKGKKLIPLEGISLLSAFRDRPDSGHNMLCWSAPQQEAIRMGNWKAIRSRNSSSWELYNVVDDGTETNDLANQQAELLKNMVYRFGQWHKRVGMK